MIVVDLGCMEQGGEDSIETLIERFHPRVLFGFDPHPAFTEGEYTDNGTLVHLEQKAAWIFDGSINFLPSGLRSRVLDSFDHTIIVPCFDLARWIYEELPAAEELVLKMDIEGAEKPVLEHLIEADIDQLIDLLLIEWHDHRDFVTSFDRHDLISRLRCPTEDWQ